MKVLEINQEFQKFSQKFHLELTQKPALWNLVVKFLQGLQSSNDLTKNISIEKKDFCNNFISTQFTVKLIITS